MSLPEEQTKTFPEALVFGEATRVGDIATQRGGLTKREYFASKAPMRQLTLLYKDRECATAEEAASYAVKYADALIKELNR